MLESHLLLKAIGHLLILTKTDPDQEGFDSFFISEWTLSNWQCCPIEVKGCKCEFAVD